MPLILALGGTAQGVQTQPDLHSDSQASQGYTISKQKQANQP